MGDVRTATHDSRQLRTEPSVAQSGLGLDREGADYCVAPVLCSMQWRRAARSRADWMTGDDNLE